MRICAEKSADLCPISYSKGISDESKCLPCTHELREWNWCSQRRFLRTGISGKGGWRGNAKLGYAVRSKGFKGA